jgi:glutamyl-tRNA reductase
MLHVVGVDHRSDPIEVGERVALDAAGATRLLDAVARRAPAIELAVLSTCNRTELYVAAPDGDGALAEVLAVHRSLRPEVADDLERTAPRARTGEHAVRHLVRVACGLESSVLGDSQVVGQVRAAGAQAADAGTFGRELHEAFTIALRTARRVRRETAISAAGAGFGAAVAELVRERTAAIDDASVVVVVGAGAMARDVARPLARRARTLVVNRTFERAAALAAEVGAVARDWSELPALLATADVVVCATAARQPVLTAAELGPAILGRAVAPLVIDLGLPRNVEAVDGVAVVGLRELQQADEHRRERCRAAVEAAGVLVEDAVAEWNDRAACRPIERVVKELHVELDAVISALAERLHDGVGVAPAAATPILRRELRRVVDAHVRRLRSLEPMRR